MRRKIYRRTIQLFLIATGLTFIFPLYWMLNLSFKSKEEVYDNAFGLPRNWFFENYENTLKSYHFFVYFKNSLIYTAGTLLLVILCGSMLAYCLARMNWRFAGAALSYISLGLVIPVQVVMIPLFMMTMSLKLQNTYPGLIIPMFSFGLSACVLMLYAFFRSLPRELEEAACIDGCNVYQSYFRIILPIVKPALATQCVLVFMNVWNEFPLSYILVTKESYRPLTVGLANFFLQIGVTDWGLIGAAMIMTSLPTIIVYLLGSEKIEHALTAGAILK
ncbi:carbohydrate ABC transporter permease [Cohnella zeiphila]|uniref:Carbohydrate ABC transporter permease n=1 Tax=Cohnella zeiphila TaxID=2761120 RepID=A0A7X0SL32_9BACL|nr:carbohydrate ABC transporter permease [Cohnella zeiphila]MBB6731854.1 carbohydrate ABC transporter permease [Cohnella zeiphila]